MTGPGPREAHLARAKRHREEAVALGESSARLGTVRFVVFFLALAPWVIAEMSPTVPDAVGWLSVPLFAGFLHLVGRHRRLKDRLRREEVAERLALDGAARIDRRWDDLPDPPDPPPAAGPDHAWAVDLDLYGHASLRSILGPVHTPMGRTELDAWLLRTASASASRARQEAVRALAACDDVRERAAVEGALLEPVDDDALRGFLAWCEGPPLLTRRAVLLAWGLPFATLLLGVTGALGLAPGWLWLLPLAGQGLVARAWSGRLRESFARSSSGVPGLRRYHRLLRVWEDCPGGTGLLDEVLGRLRGDGETASEALARLDRPLDLADARFSSLHPVLAIGLLWDLHVGRLLDGWRASAGTRVRSWMEALGILEALSALATTASDHPGWTFPELLDEAAEPSFEALAIGHPLLPDAECVRNDVTLGPPGRVLLITGSNMSGKSTLLRAIGLAVVLAGAGGPVCADRLRLPGIRLFTSMRVQDSLEAGVSFFMAELERLAALLARAPAAGAGGPALLYLVDEILQGTNSDERRIAGRRLVRHLLRRRAIGAVTTHDLEFHRHSEIEAAAEKVHFRESVEGPSGAEVLSFDYRLRPGLATTRNALRLAERVGLTDPDDLPATDS